MKAIIAWSLLLVGGGLMLYGGYLAIRELAGLYQGALNDPLGQPEGSEQHVASSMWHGLTIAGVGIVPFLVGTVWVKILLFKKLRETARRPPR